MKTKIDKDFPFWTSIETYHDYLDEHAVWCYENFGYEDGTCTLDENLAFGKACPGAPLDHDGYEEFIQQFDDMNKRASVRKIWQIWNIEHSHEGVWKRVYIRKTGYDYGIERFYFRNNKDLFWFILNRL